MAFITFLAVINTTQAKDVSAYSKPEVRQFIREMVRDHHFSEEYLAQLFKQVRWTQKVPLLTPIQKPTKPVVSIDKSPWWKYRETIVNETRIREGVAFWKQHQAVLKKAEETYGVPASIIVGTLGVETRYGRITGKHSTLHVLTTLSFNKTRRNKFFRNELKEFLLLTREQKLNPLTIKGSYAGALGWPQFMPSSYRRHAVKFGNRGNIDLFNHAPDIIGSIANYYRKHGWKTGQPVFANASVSGNKHHLIPKKIRPTLTLSQLDQLGVKGPFAYRRYPNEKATYFNLEGRLRTQHFLGFNNFFVIMRYNPDRKYSMAVYELGQRVASAVKKDSGHRGTTTLTYENRPAPEKKLAAEG